MTLPSELCRTQHGRAQTAKRATYVGNDCCRTYLGGGVWVARCKFRDTDGVTRRVERRCPLDDFDKLGKLAEVQRIDDRRLLSAWSSSRTVAVPERQCRPIFMRTCGFAIRFCT
jgi:hypothetical protein